MKPPEQILNERIEQVFEFCLEAGWALRAEIRLRGETVPANMIIDMGNLEIIQDELTGEPWRVAEVTRDDGLTQSKRFGVSGVLADGRMLPEGMVPAEQFSSTNLSVELWGLLANIEPGQGNRDFVRHALQLTAAGIDSRTEYTHLGWRFIGSGWEYIHAGMTGEVE